MLIVTALSAAPHLTANVTSLIQNIATEEPAEVTSLLSQLATLLNFTASAAASSGLPTLSTVFSGTEFYTPYTSDNSASQISDTSVIPNETIFYWNDTGDDFTNAHMEDFLYGNLTFIDEQINTSLSINFTEIEDGLFNSTDGHLDTISSYYTDGSATTNNVTVLNMGSTAFEVSETDLDSNSRNLSLEEYFDNTSSNFTDNFVSTESIPPLNFVSVANSIFDEDTKSHGLTSVMESEELTSVVITTLETLLAQSKDFMSTSQYTEHISQMIQKTTAAVADSTKCYSSQCNTLPTDGTSSSWEPSFAPDAVSGKHSTAITTEATSTLAESHGMCKIMVTEYSYNKRIILNKGHL
jgi:archaellum component FlaF (FlaF/FlaG flagellin family)